MASAQEKLAQALAQTLQAQIAPEIAKLTAAVDKLTAENRELKEQLGKEFAVLNSSLMAVLARTEATQAGQAGGKKPARGEKKVGDAPAANAANAANGVGAAADGIGKVRNSYLYARHAMKTDLAFREKYNRAAAAQDPTVAKHAPGTDAHWQALGAACWSKGFWTPEEKAAVTAHFEEWKQKVTRGAAQPNLVADAKPAVADDDLSAVAGELGV